MTHLQLFTEIFGENVFTEPRNQYKTDRRIASYYFMHTVLDIGDSDTARALGRSRTAVIHGRQRFLGLMESGDKIAIAIWKHMNERIKLLYSDLEGRGEINKGELEVVPTKE